MKNNNNKQSNKAQKKANNSSSYANSYSNEKNECGERSDKSEGNCSNQSKKR